MRIYEFIIFKKGFFFKKYFVLVSNRERAPRQLPYLPASIINKLPLYFSVGFIFFSIIQQITLEKFTNIRSWYYCTKRILRDTARPVFITECHPVVPIDELFFYHTTLDEKRRDWSNKTHYRKYLIGPNSSCLIPPINSILL